MAAFECHFSSVSGSEQRIKCREIQIGTLPSCFLYTIHLIKHSLSEMSHKSVFHTEKSMNKGVELKIKFSKSTGLKTEHAEKKSACTHCQTTQQSELCQNAK